MRTLTFNRVIGNGGMGTVYHAELRVPRGFARQCAVKVMKASSPDQEHFRARMRDEARLLGMLQDEQILGVSELVRVDGHDGVVMDYVEGVDLADLIRVKTLPARALAELGAEMAGTVQRAHNATHPTTGEPLHVIHRDVKPANVMITSRGGVRLLDFGVARAAFASRESHTQGLVLGTLNYFPPEILAGGDPTPAVDIYGLGLTLWECATGRDWGSPQVHRYRFERRVEQRLGEISEDYSALVPVLRQLLQWDPAARPNGGAVETALLAAADTCAGEGLRTWARQIVPPILADRETKPQTDELVGRTFQIEGGLPDAPEAQPLDSTRPIVPGSPELEEETFNDLAPPSAVRRVDDDVDLLPEHPVAGDSVGAPTVRMAVPSRGKEPQRSRREAPQDGNGRLIAIGVAVILILMLLGALAATAILLLLWLLLG